MTLRQRLARPRLDSLERIFGAVGSAAAISLLILKLIGA